MLTSDEDPSLSFRIHFRGHSILEKGLELLLAGRVVSDDGEVVMPALEDAELALVTGFSAGSGGVLNNGDWFAEQLEPNGTTVRLVRDASFKPRTDIIPDPGVRSEVEAALEEGLILMSAGSDPTKIRMLPPLNTTDEELEACFAILEKAMRRVAEECDLPC